MPVSLSSLRPDGGKAGALHLFVSRRYPRQFMERSPGSDARVFRGARAEDRRAREFEAEARRRMEEAVEDQLGSKPPQQRGRLYQPDEVSQLSTGEELQAALRSALNADELQAWLTERQRDVLTRHREQLLPPLVQQRQVTPLVRLLVIGTEDADLDEGAVATLTVWNPEEGAESWLREGCGLLVLGANVGSAASGGHRMSLNLSRGGLIRPLELGQRADLILTRHRPRSFLRLPLPPAQHAAAIIDNNELDLRGLLVAVWDDGQMMAVLADPERCDGDGDCGSAGLVCVRVWAGLASLGLAGLALTGRPLAAFNLQRRSTGAEVLPGLPLLHFTDLSDLSALNPADLPSSFRSALNSSSTLISRAREFLSGQLGLGLPDLDPVAMPTTPASSNRNQSLLQRHRFVDSPTLTRQIAGGSGVRQPGLRRSIGFKKQQQPTPSSSDNKEHAALVATNSSISSSCSGVGNSRKRRSQDSIVGADGDGGFDGLSAAAAAGAGDSQASLDVSIADLVKTKRRSLAARSPSAGN
ncbi:hypothetical protein BOX15_Mlig002409g1 [Macrostomum lignano]|uniref:Uncharacterized protein n=1 Tax=Macrostomum lignano TaxID=282301 RepID=A0A267FPD7_9PLAT|nr:hypothetical protein BOX15_Mlig002409g1 [Macrostomum lignano]